MLHTDTRLPLYGRRLWSETASHGELQPSWFLSRLWFPIRLGRPGELVAELIKNTLDDGELDPADKLKVKEELEALADPDLPEDEQTQRWAKVKELAPKVLAASGRVVERLVTEAMRQALGL